MEQALCLARLAVGQVSPNPAVGAVVVRDGEIVGQGYTQPPGSHHAEVMALNQAGSRASGADIYVTLEPCAHQGRTPPCTKAIIDAGVSNVHFAMLDPSPLVSGRGEEELQREGIRTYIGEHEGEAREVNEAYIRYITTGIPFITVKFAMSLDGKIATKSGHSRWISGMESRKYVHCLRYSVDAIMVGVNTVIADDPQLTCRYGGGKGGTVKEQPLRVIVDGQGRVPPTARIFSEPGRVLLAVGKIDDEERKKALLETGAEILELPSGNGMVDLRALMEMLGKLEVTNVLVEGGGILLGSMFDDKLVDKVVAFIAPIIIGGEGARTAVAGKGVGRVTDALRLEGVSVERFGEDVMLSGYVKR
jgi:diaminohydroxyphosphoribosylaminopyrimidine deaminase/5-amino-6-(5-phosphoribosylamino)uracil reductase